MTGNRVTRFQKIANRKGWTFEDIGKRWDKSERQISRIAKAEEPRDMDALNGLPDKKIQKIEIKKINKEQAMPTKIQHLKSKLHVKVTFEIEKKDAKDAQHIVLLSEHNNWIPLELKKFKNGKFKVVETISTDDRDSLQFIYKATAKDGHEFTLLPEGADDYVDNGMADGGKNAVLVIAEGL
jgi:hypothetical protein